MLCALFIDIFLTPCFNLSFTLCLTDCARFSRILKIAISPFLFPMLLVLTLLFLFSIEGVSKWRMFWIDLL